MNSNKIKELKQKAKIVREGILDCIGIDKKGHLGGSMSSADLVAALYFYKMRINPDNPDDPDRDRIIFSKGHSVLAQYAVLAELGYFSKSELKNTKKLGSILQGHPETRTPAIEDNTGSLGQGLSIGIGMALAARLDHKVRENNFNYCTILVNKFLSNLYFENNRRFRSYNVLVFYK